MGISTYLKDIGRGKAGARSLTRPQAADLMAQVLDGAVTDLEVGGFCLAMRIKGESPEEMAGFWDAAQARMLHVPDSGAPTVVLPSYNGARKLPVLTPLLALLLAREGVAVLMHGSASEDQRVTSQAVCQALGVPQWSTVEPLLTGQCAFLPTEVLCPSLKRLLDVRRTVGLRNSAHSLVKLLNPCQGRSLLVTCYTHPEYAVSMTDTLNRVGAHAVLLRGTEGEPVADARRIPRMTALHAGQAQMLQTAQTGTLLKLPELPSDIGAEATAAYIQRVMQGQCPVPEPIALQVKLLLRELQRPALAVNDLSSAHAQAL